MHSVLKNVLGILRSFKSKANFRGIGCEESRMYILALVCYNSLSPGHYLGCLIIDFRCCLSQARPKRLKTHGLVRQEQVQCRAGLFLWLWRSPRACHVEEIALVQAQPCCCADHPDYLTRLRKYNFLQPEPTLMLAKLWDLMSRERSLFSIVCSHPKTNSDIKVSVSLLLRIIVWMHSGNYRPRMETLRYWQGPSARSGA